MAQPASPDIHPVVAGYLKSLSASVVRKQRWFAAEFRDFQCYFDATVIECWVLPAGTKFKYLSNHADGQGDIHWQYKVPHPTKSCFRPLAYRVPFLTHSEFLTDSYTVSHLCHFNACMNPAHHILEPLEINKARNGCPGGRFCCHQTPCLIPGPYHDK